MTLQRNAANRMSRKDERKANAFEASRYWALANSLPRQEPRKEAVIIPAPRDGKRPER